MNFLLKSIALLCLILIQSCSDGVSPFISGTTGEIRIGSGTGENFVDGAIELESPSITEGGSIEVRVNIVDSAGTLANVAGNVTFTSTCADQSEASFSPATLNIFSSTASSTYNHLGCTETDSLTATATLDSGTELVATASLSVTQVVQLGSGSGAGFQPGALTLENTSIISSGNSTVSVNIVDVNNTLITDLTTVSFSSNCANSSLASFTIPSVVTTSGTATTTYLDNGCIGGDFITATLQNGSTSLTASGQISILPLRIGSGSGGSFLDSIATIADGSINSGDSTTVSVNIVDSNGTPYTSPVTINFTSTCSAKAPEEAQFIPSSLITATGTATATYVDKGCPGSDLITVELVNGTSAPNPTAINTVLISPLKVGTGSGGTFNESAITLTSATITEGTSTTVSVNIVDSANALITSPVTVNFNSNCADADPATASFTSSSVVTSTGTASTTYIDAGCPASDTIVATLNAAGTVDPTASGAVSIAPLRVGSGSGGSFGNGVVTLGLTSISAGGTTSVSANVVDDAGDLITTPVTVNFESNCVTQGIASFDNNSASTINGTASVTFTADTGCTGTDTIRAKINPFGNNERVATADLTVASPGLGSIQFTSTDNDVIALSGTGNSSGLEENATLTFTVFDSTGQPLSGANVTFALNTVLGGINLQSATDTSDADGLVQAIVQSGTVATSVRVTATIDATTFSTQSTAIVISTGLPDQDSFSLSATTLNPQAWDRDGIKVTLTARLSDRFNNPIQDGTNINFTTELGSIISACSTVDGACSVEWTSQSPRGVAGPGTNAGRTTILAHVVGEESFVDVDGDGVYSNDDGNLAGGAFGDLPEPFVDWNENGVRETGIGTAEPFKDFNNSGTYNSPDTEFNGVVCTHTTECSTQETTFVWDSLVLVMAENNPQIVMVEDNSGTLCDNTNANTADDCFDDGTTTGITYPSAIKVGSFLKTLTFTIVGNTNFQIMPSGTKIDFSVDNGKIVGTDSHTVLNTSANTYDIGGLPNNLSVAKYSVTIQKDTTATDDGSLSITVAAPDGPTTTFTSIPIDDRPLFVTIDLPTSTTFTEGAAFTLAGTAIDPEDNNISGNIVWTSSIDGALGTGASINVNGGVPLSVGSHTITATITDSDTNVRQATKNITIEAIVP